MRKFTVALAAIFFSTLMFATPALAGSAHFINNAFSISRDGNSLTVSGKEAGLGDLAQVEIQVTATASCINPGNKKPQAANKQDLAGGGQFPVQNGKADFSVTLTASFQPDCSPPMTVVFTDVVVTDLTNGISKSFPGTF